MTISSIGKESAAIRELAEFYNHTRQQKVSKVRATNPPHLLIIPKAEGVYTAWENIKKSFLTQQNCSNTRTIHQGITLLKQHINICYLARLFRNYLVKEKEAMDDRNTLHAGVVEKVSKCKYCSYVGVDGSKHLRTININTDYIESSETAAIFMSYGNRMTPMESLSIRELNTLICELTDLKEDSEKDDVKEMCDAFIIFIENYITYKSIRKKWWDNEYLLENDIYQRLLSDQNILRTFIKIPAFRQVLDAHKQMIILKDTADFIPERRILIEATEETFFSEEVERINTVFQSLEGFRKEDIRRIIAHSKLLRGTRGTSSGLKRELFEIQKNIYKLLNLFEDPKPAPAPTISRSIDPATSFLPKDTFKPKKSAPTCRKKSRPRRSTRRTPQKRTAPHQVRSLPKPSKPAQKPVPKIWTKEVPTYPFPHHLLWDQRIIRWFRRDPECLEEGSYKDLSLEEKKLEHHSHSLPPCLDTFLNSEYAVRSIWKSTMSGETDDMYSLPMAIEYEDPNSGKNVLEFGHHCTVVNPRTKVIYHRYFHRSERQTFYRTGLTKDALRDIWKEQKHLPKLSRRTTIPVHKNNRPKEDVEKLYNRFTRSIVIIDKLYGLKITLFEPSNR